MNSKHPKFIASLTFRGFEMSPSQVESLVSVPATELCVRGASRRPGTPPLHHSFSRWELALADTTRLDEMIPSLLAALGGAEKLCAVQQQGKAEFLEVDLAMWVKDSDEQEGGFIDPKTIATLAGLGATLSFGFYSRNDA